MPILGCLGWLADCLSGFTRKPPGLLYCIIKMVVIDAVFVACVLQGLSKTGMQYHWDLRTASSSRGAFTLLVSASKPCEGFRVWLHHELKAEEAAERAASTARLEAIARESVGGVDGEAPHTGQGSSDAPELDRYADVTALVAELPPLHPSARQPVRNWSQAEEVLRGKDYSVASSWVLRLPPHLLEQASGITVWIGEAPAGSVHHWVQCG